MGAYYYTTSPVAASRTCWPRWALISTSSIRQAQSTIAGRQSGAHSRQATSCTQSLRRRSLFAPSRVNLPRGVDLVMKIMPDL